MGEVMWTNQRFYISPANQTLEIILIYKIFSENNKIFAENCSQRLDDRMGVLVG